MSIPSWVNRLIKRVPPDVYEYNRWGRKKLVPKVADKLSLRAQDTLRKTARFLEEMSCLAEHSRDSGYADECARKREYRRTRPRPKK